MPRIVLKKHVHNRKDAKFAKKSEGCSLSCKNLLNEIFFCVSFRLSYSFPLRSLRSLRLCGSTAVLGVICLIAMSCILSVPVYAGHGTIKETDTEIIVEYSGDDDDKQAAKVLKEEQQKEVVKQEKEAEVTKRKNALQSEKNAARITEPRKDGE